MLPPVACFNCHKIICKACIDYQQKLKEQGLDKSKKILDELGLVRYCCRTAVMTFTDISQDLPFGKGM